MKHNYKIRVDEPDPSDEAINRHRNFDRLLADHRNLTEPLYRRPLYKNPRAFIGLVLIAVVAFLVFQAVEEEDKAQALAEMPIELKRAEQSAFLNPPVQTLAPQVESFQIHASQDTALTLASGTKVVLPENAFDLADESLAEGNPILSLSIVELSDPFEALLAGLPLAMGEGQCIAPSHLYQIHAELDGKPVALQADAGIRIESENARNLFENDDVLYALDTASHAWKPLGNPIEVEKRNQPGNKASLNDGFGALEYNEDGSVVESHVEEESETGKPFWVRSFNAAGTGWMMCGNSLEVEAAERRVQLVGADEQPLPLMALYQLVLEGEAIRVSWPQSKDYHFDVTPEGSVFGFLPDGRMAWVKDTGRGGALKASLSEKPLSSKEEIKKYLGLTAP